MELSWPATLWIVRHGQIAHAGAVTDPPQRDLELPLSPLGEAQASALGRWFAAMPAAQRPTVVLASPYRRARRTGERIAEAGGLANPDVEIVPDERLREKEPGILDRAGPAEVKERFPEQADLRQRLGD